MPKLANFHIVPSIFSVHLYWGVGMNYIKTEMLFSILIECQLTIANGLKLDGHISLNKMGFSDIVEMRPS